MTYPWNNGKVYSLQKTMSTEIPQLEQKYELVKMVEHKLKIWFMCIMKSNFNPMYTGVVAYDHESALAKAKETWCDNVPTTALLSFGDNVLVEDILKNVNLTQGKPVEIEKKVMPIDNFKTSLLLAADVYLEDKKDKTTIKRIINKI